METVVHPEEEKALAAAARKVPPPSQTAFRRWLARLGILTTGSARHERLEGSLRTAQAEIDRRICARRQRAPDGAEAARSAAVAGDLSWEDGAVKLLAEASSAVAMGQIDQGWRLLHAARRMEIFGFDPEGELAALAAALREESEKLKGWRQKAIERILGKAEKPAQIDVHAVYRAAAIRDEHYDNQGYKDGLLKTQILTLVLILVATAGALLSLARGDFLFGQTDGFHTVVGVMLFGLLGATVSAVFATSDTTQTARIPEITAASRLTVMRVMVGGASALVIYVFLKSQLTAVFNEELAEAAKTLQPYTNYAVAFVAGFSERLVLRAVETVAGKEQKKTAPEEKPS
jgi:hypothetical protein